MGATNLISDDETPEEAFERARQAYPERAGKRGHDTEWNNFVRKHRDWATVAYDLFPAIKLIGAARAQERKKDSRAFIPRWPMFQTWINQRRWEEAAEL